jgi:hypothetical protein
MIPAIGSEWYARDGRVMRVDSVDVPDDPAVMPRATLTVLNAGRRMRKTTTMSTDNFGSELYFGFLRPRKKDDVL